MKRIAWVAVGLLVGCDDVVRELEKQAERDAQPPVIDTPVQVEREAFIKRLCAEGYFAKVEMAGSLPDAWVTGKFLALNRGEQGKLLEVVYAYYMEGWASFGCHGTYCDDLVLKVGDGTPLGRRVGAYDPVNGVRF